MRSQRKNHAGFRLGVFFLFALIFVGCSETDRSGELGIQLNWLPDADSRVASFRGGMIPEANLAGADLIRVTIKGQFTDVIKEFLLSKYPDGALISGIPAGSGILVQVEALRQVTEKAIYSGSRSGVEIQAGRETGVSILMTREGEFSLLSPLNSPRAFAASATLPDGQILLAGGARNFSDEGDRWKISPDGSLEVYQPELGSFRVLEAELDVPRVFHTLTLLSDGTLIVAGGMVAGWLDPDLSIQAGSLTNSIEFFRPESGLVSDFGRLNFPRFFHTADILADGRILVAGGWGEDGKKIQTAEVLNPESGEIEIVQMLTGRAGHRSLSLPQGSILLWGGNAGEPLAEIYVPGQGFQPFAGGTSYPVVEYHTLDLVDNWILISGGVIREPYLVLADGWLVDLAREKPDRKLPLNSVRAFHSSFKLPSGEICLAGGIQNISDLAGGRKVECFNPATQDFQAVAELNQGRFGHTAVGLADGNALIVGGVVGNRDSLEATFSAEIYNPPGW